jgi:flavin-dependent dehydrogenase
MRWDALVAGAGPAGCVAARVLARAGRRVLLVDEAAPPARPGAGCGAEPGGGPGARPGARKVGESLPAAARPLLRDLGLLALVEGGPHLPCHGNLSAWGETVLRASDFLRDPHGLGWHLDRRRFDADLRAAALEAGAESLSARLLAVEGTATGVRARAGDRLLEAGWIVDATGRAAAVARRLGARRLRDDGLVALCAWTGAIAGDADTRTLVESTADGWWYTARLADGSRVLVCHLDAAEAAVILRSPGAWERALARTVHVQEVVRGAPLLARPRATEACGARLVPPGGRCWLAAGDAALSFDPLSSQGIFNALHSGMRAGQAVDAALAGDREAPRRYAARLAEVRAIYLARHRAVYASERRWRDRPFWRRRDALAAPALDAAPRFSAGGRGPG